MRQELKRAAGQKPWEGIPFSRLRERRTGGSCSDSQSGKNLQVVDRIDAAARSRNMSRIRSRDTIPELRLRRILHAAGLRYALHRKDLPGTPDVVLARHRVTIFVHGCFWHGHACTRGHVSRSNLAYWSAKISRNQQRHRRSARKLREMGWSVWVVWECAIEKGAAAVLRKIDRELCT